jgi:hypothetical protein
MTFRGLLTRVWGQRQTTAEPISVATHRAEPAGRGTPQASVLPVAQTQEDVEEVDRLVRLTFAALLRREPDSDTLLAYRQGFAQGSTFRDLVDDVVASEEYRSARKRVEQRRMDPVLAEAAQDDSSRDNIQTAVSLLTARLVEKGCRIQLGELSDDDPEDVDDRRRMRSLRVTLSVLDRL